MIKYLITAGLAFTLAFALLSNQSASKSSTWDRQTMMQEMIGCGNPFYGEILPAEDGSYAPVFPGWGHYHYTISTRTDSAQFFFDQGLSLYYSYHLTEALASFREASRRDPASAMACWGEALAMGPFYNNSYTYRMPPTVLPVLDRMNGLASQASDKEKDLIRVMNLRYSTDKADGSRPALNKAYSDGMKALIGKYPGDIDLEALYVDGVMIEHSWDTWDPAGKPKPWMPELIKYCEHILSVEPHHPAALHYHIHLVEASPHPEVALHDADVLHGLMPGVAHMVHMASHMYQRNGLYAKGVEINDLANSAQHTYYSMVPSLHLNSSVVHYHAVQAFCALNAGMYRKGMEAAGRCRYTIDHGMPPSALKRNYIQYLYMMPEFVLVRLGKWQELLAQPVPDSSLIYASLLDDFARGIAYLRTNRMEEAEKCLEHLRDKLKDPVLAIRSKPNNAPIEGANVAEGILAGEIFFAKKEYDAAMTAFRRAIKREDEMVYNEPSDWPLPARHFAGACLLKINQPKSALTFYHADLTLNPGNGWSLLGLAQCLQQQRLMAQGEWMQGAKKAFASAEEMPPASAY